MATIRTKFMVGMFVVIGLSLAVVAIIWLGMANYFEEGQLYVAYFDESVQGLDKDSPVKYRGVSIGRVYSIGVAPDSNLIQVVLKIETSIDLDESIVAQLKSVGITGLMFVELEKLEDRSLVLTHPVSFSTKYPIINTKPSDKKQFFDAVNDVLNEFKSLNFGEVSRHLQSTLEKIDQAIEDAEIQQMSRQIQALIGNIQSLTDSDKSHTVIDRLNTSLDAVSDLAAEGKTALSNLDTAVGHADAAIVSSEKEIRLLIADMKESMTAIKTLTENGNALISRSATEMVRFMSRLNLALQQYEKAGKNLNRFLYRIADQPSQLIFSEPPEKDSIRREREK